MEAILSHSDTGSILSEYIFWSFITVLCGSWLHSPLPPLTRNMSCLLIFLGFDFLFVIFFSFCYNSHNKFGWNFFSFPCFSSQSRFFLCLKLPLRSGSAAQGSWGFNGSLGITVHIPTESQRTCWRIYWGFALLMKANRMVAGHLHNNNVYSW